MSDSMLICESAKVVALEDQAVWLETIRQSSCGACSLQKGCGQSALQSLFNGKRNHIRLSTDQLDFSLQLNDQVEIGIPKAAVLHGSLGLYLLPLLGLIAGIALGSHYQLNDLWALVSGLILMFASFVLIREVSALPKIKETITPRILRVLSRSPQTVLIRS